MTIDYLSADTILDNCSFEIPCLLIFNFPKVGGTHMNVIAPLAQGQPWQLAVGRRQLADGRRQLAVGKWQKQGNRNRAGYA